jgi:hypothetical protein
MAQDISVSTPLDIDHRLSGSHRFQNQVAPGSNALGGP